ncbi:uncharacterized protein [Haliotis cracherodii]|uniref:uncharacterized protein LOC124140576 n=1 Tax=Haliotis rufescens TaxID=6454 RepID=UPI001EB001DA|nr:uncharacterized protein LOC124140576 [Haliotis rufescens]
MNDILRKICIFCAALVVASGLQCYVCDSAGSEFCGANVNTERIKPVECDDENVKCGTQIQDPAEDGWVGVMRVCYPLGSLPRMNETNGCHQWSNNNFTARFCFCETDGCNSKI